MLLCHGDADPVVPHRWGQESASILKKLNKCVDFRTYKGMSHSSSDKVKDLFPLCIIVLSLINTLCYRKWRISRHLLNKLCHNNRAKWSIQKYCTGTERFRPENSPCWLQKSLFDCDLLELSAINFFFVSPQFHIFCLVLWIQFFYYQAM